MLYHIPQGGACPPLAAFIHFTSPAPSWLVGPPTRHGSGHQRPREEGGHDGYTCWRWRHARSLHGGVDKAVDRTPLSEAHAAEPEVIYTTLRE